MGKLKFCEMKRGFTIIEVLIASTITIVILSVVGLSLFNFRRVQALDNDTRRIVATLRDAQQKSITQEDIDGSLANERWGVHFDAGVGGQEWYEVFRGDGFPGVTSYRKLLSDSVTFKNVPVEGIDVFFEKISGETLTPLSIVLELENNPSESRTITIQDNGTITY